MDSSKKTTVKLSRKIDLRGSQGRIFLKINTTFNTHVILAVFFRVYSRRIFKNQRVESFIFLWRWINSNTFELIDLHNNIKILSL